MSNFVPFPPPEPVEGLYLVGFRLDPAHDGPQFYTLFALEGENERPLVSDGRLLFFSDPGQAGEALQQADNVTGLGPVPSELEMMIDVAQALYVVNSQSRDEDGTLLEVIGCFDDLIRAAQLNVPAEYIPVLSSLSERLMENPEFATWLKRQGLDRERIEDALIWCVGAVAVKSSWL